MAAIFGESGKQSDLAQRLRLPASNADFGRLCDVKDSQASKAMSSNDLCDKRVEPSIILCQMPTNCQLISTMSRA
jgi:hypothetical protein